MNPAISRGPDLDTAEEALNKPATDAAKTRAKLEQPRVENLPSGVRLDSSLLRSVAWNAAGDWGTQLFTWGDVSGGHAAADALKDFGIMALAGILMPYLSQLTGLGLREPW